MNVTEIGAVATSELAALRPQLIRPLDRQKHLRAPAVVAADAAMSSRVRKPLSTALLNCHRA